MIGTERKLPEGMSQEQAEEIINAALDHYEASESADHENKKAWIDDFRFSRLAEQWPEAIQTKREAESRPCLTLNRLPAFIRQVTNDARQNKPAIKVKAAGGEASEEVAEILCGLIRNIEQTSNADVAYDTALDHGVTGGFGYIRVCTEYAHNDSFDQDLRIERIVNPLSVSGDPNSTEADSSDWNQCLISEMMLISDFEKKYPEASTAGWEAGSDKDHDGWGEDDKIRIAEYWEREEVEKTIYLLTNGEVLDEDGLKEMADILVGLGISVKDERVTKSYKVTQYILTAAEVLEVNPWAGQYIPIIPVYGDEVNIEGERFFISLVRFAKDPQRMFNYWRTASTELVALAPKTPFIGPAGAFETDHDKWQTANTNSHPYIEYDVVPGATSAPQRQTFAGPPSGALQEAANAGQDIKDIMGIHDASLGARSNETSGRAILARQREGDVSTFNFIDNLSRAIRHVGRVLVDMIPHVYNEARIVRILKEDGSTKDVPINQEHQVKPAENQEDQDQQEAQEFQEGITKIFDLTVGKYDVTVTAGPSFSTRREESASQMMQFVQAVPAAGQVAGDLIATSMDWPGADELAKRLKSMLPPQAQGQNPMVMQLQQQIHQIQQQASQAVQHLQQQLTEATRKNDMDAVGKQLEAKKLEIDGYNAETNRLKVVQVGMGPEQVQALVMQTIQQLLAGPGIEGGAVPPPGPPQMGDMPGGM